MTEEAKATLLDAVSAGIETLGEPPAPAEDDTVGDTTGTDTAGDSGAGNEGASGTTDTSGEDSGETGADDGTAGDVSADAPGDDEGAGGKSAGDGKAVKDGAGKPAGTDGKAAPTDEKAKAEAAKKEREAHINGPVDARLSEKTRTRMTFLANEVKRQDTELAQARQQLGHADEMLTAIESTGMEPGEFANMLGYAHARHHGTPEQKQKALTFLKGELRALALELGDTAGTGYDPLEEHPDLKAAVEQNTITQEHAQELAIARSRAKITADTSAANSATTQAQQAHAAGVQALTTSANQLLARDGAAVFAAKRAILGPMLKPILAEQTPDKWAATFQRAYEALPKPAAAAPKVPKVPTQSPQRPGTPAGGQGKKEPKSLFEAISSAVDGDDE